MFVADIQSGPKKWYPAFNIGTISANVHQF